MKLTKIVLVLILTLLLACKSEQNKSTKLNLQRDSLNYAKGFTIEYGDNIKLITVFNPWQGANAIKYKYALVDKNAK